MVCPEMADFTRTAALSLENVSTVVRTLSSSMGGSESDLAHPPRLCRSKALGAVTSFTMNKARQLVTAVTTLWTSSGNLGIRHIHYVIYTQFMMICDDRSR